MLLVVIQCTLHLQAVEVDHTPAITLPILDETDVTSEHDISCVSTISKASSSNVSKFSADDGEYIVLALTLGKRQ